MKQILSAIPLLGLALLSPNTPVLAHDCVCEVVPMFPDPENAENWFHYAIVCDGDSTDCAELYPTGTSGPTSWGESCQGSGVCFNCDSLSGDSGKMGSLYFKSDPLGYLKLNTKGDFVDFLCTNTGDPDSARFFYEKCEYSFMIASDEMPCVVALNRTVNGVVEKFYAIVWRYSRTSTDDNGRSRTGRGYIGVEITGAIPADVPRLVPYKVRNAVIVSANADQEPKPVEGVLEVQISNSKFDVAMIRLHDSTANKNADWSAAQP